MSSCPPRDQLQQFLSGELNAQAEQAACEHIENCASCQALLEELTAFSSSPTVPGIHNAPLENGTNVAVDRLSRSKGPRASSLTLPHYNSRSKLNNKQLHQLLNLLPLGKAAEHNSVLGNATDPEWPVVPGYEIVGELGQGGMGVVYEARQLRLNRRAALKMIRSGDLATPEQLVRFCAEGEILAGLQHPNIVQIFEVGTHGKQPYMALELMEGGSLADALSGQPLPIRAVAELVETLARAVEYAHGIGVVHRDLNPANVLLRKKSEPRNHKSSNPSSGRRPSQVHDPRSGIDQTYEFKISDFGLARHLAHDSRLTRTGYVMGTPSYMAPEQVRGQADEVGPLADLYALGAIMYEALVGHPPFQAPTSREVMNQVADLEPVAPSRLSPKIPRDLEIICLKCLEKDPSRRYPTVAELADDLRRFLDGVPICARRAATIERTWRWAKRRPLVAGLTLSVVLTLITGSVISSYFAIKASRRAREAEQASQKTLQALNIADAARRQAELRAAELRFRSALEQCEAGAVDRGMFAMLEAWRAAPQEAVEFRRVVRMNMAAWSQQLPVLEQMFQHPLPKYVLSRFSADGKSLVAWDFPQGQRAVRWDTHTGQQIGLPFVVPDGEYIVDVNQQGTMVSTDKENMSRIRVAANGELIGSEFQHRPRGLWTVGGLALFSPVDRIMVTRSLQLGNPQRYRMFWRIPAGSGGDDVVAQLATIRLEHGDSYHVTSNAGVQPIAVVFRQQSAAGSAPPRVEFWDLSTGNQITQLPTSLSHSDPHINWDGGTILSVDGSEMRGFFAGNDLAVRWWDATTGQMIGVPWRPRRPVQRMSLAADGQIVAVQGQDQRIRLFDLTRGLQRGGEIRTAQFPGGDNDARVSVSPDGSRTATASPEGIVRLWQTRHSLPQATHASNPRTPAAGTSQASFQAGVLSWDGRTGLLCSPANSGLGILVKSEPGPPVTPLRQKHLLHAAFSPDGSLIATAPYNHQFGGRTTIHLWDRTGRAFGLPLPQYRYIHSLAFSSDGRTLAVGCVGGVVLWDVATTTLRHVLRESSPATNLVFSPDSRRLAVAHVSGWPGVGAGVRLWDVNNGLPVGEFLPGTHPPSTRAFFVLAFAHDSETLRVFDLISGKLHSLETRTGLVRRAPLELPPARLGIFSEHGTALATSDTNETVQQWEPDTGRPRGSFLELPEPAVRLAYSPGGETLAVVCRSHAVRLFDADRCVPLGPMLLHRAGLVDLRFNPDSHSLITLTEQGRLCTWRLPQPVADDPDRMEVWLQANAGVRLENNFITLLDPQAWRARREQLRSRWPDIDPALQPITDEANWHETRARDAEEDGNTFAALWHLDRLIALEPSEWRHYAHKGLLYLKAGELSLGESEYGRAKQHAPEVVWQNWLRQRAATCLSEKQWNLALRHLEWLVAAGADDWQVHADRAEAYRQLGQVADSAAARARALQLGANATYLLELAEEKASQKNWTEAAELFALASAQGELDAADECHHAIVCLQAGDEAGYQRICSRLALDLQSGGQTTIALRRGSASVILEFLRTCVLRANAVADWRPLLALGDEALEASTQDSTSTPAPKLIQVRADCLAARGAVLCRLGHYQDAISSIQESASPSARVGNAFDWAFLGLAHLKLGQRADARTWIKKGIEAKVDPKFSWDAIQHDLLKPFLLELQNELDSGSEIQF